MALTQINSANVKGESGTGYESPDGKGPFECGNCSFYEKGDEENGLCGQEDMKRRSARPKADDGRVEVEEDGCCEYVSRTGKDHEDEKGEPGEANEYGAAMGEGPQMPKEMEY